MWRGREYAADEHRRLASDISSDFVTTAVRTRSTDCCLRLADNPWIPLLTLHPNETIPKSAREAILTRNVSGRLERSTVKKRLRKDPLPHRHTRKIPTLWGRAALANLLREDGTVEHITRSLCKRFAPFGDLVRVQLELNCELHSGRVLAQRRGNGPADSGSAAVVGPLEHGARSADDSDRCYCPSAEDLRAGTRSHRRNRRCHPA